MITVLDSKVIVFNWYFLKIFFFITKYSIVESYRGIVGSYRGIVTHQQRNPQQPAHILAGGLSLRSRPTRAVLQPSAFRTVGLEKSLIVDKSLKINQTPNSDKEYLILIKPLNLMKSLLLFNCSSKSIDFSNRV